jgi:xylulose-5-phosphate/fructose-6-phosphate phosphoketolase
MSRHARLASALWRAITYLSVVQLHLVDNVAGRRALSPSDIKETPSGHWGTVPGTAWILAHLALARVDDKHADVIPVIGPGHAGIVQLSLAWLTGDLAMFNARYSRDAEGLRALARDFPHVDGLGAEVTPLLPGGVHQGGRLGGALAFAYGMALDSNTTTVPIIGDGECETPSTAAAWLAMTQHPARVLPVVHLNGFRMGGRSVLGSMDDTEIHKYFAGLGRRAMIFTIDQAGPADHDLFGDLLQSALAETRRGVPVTLVLRCLKGLGGPTHLNGAPLIGTNKLHKTPLQRAARDSAQTTALSRWLRSYRPDELFTSDAVPTGEAHQAISQVSIAKWTAASRWTDASAVTTNSAADTFSKAVNDVVRRHADDRGLRIFSPDELESNRLGSLSDESWVTELLAEEVLLDMLAGWTSSGRDGLFISYEAFAPQVTAALVSYLKSRRLDGARLPSLNLLLTSYGWQNVYTHGDPSLTTAMLGTGDASVRIYMPADPARLAVTLRDCLDSSVRCNIIIAGKHGTSTHPAPTLAEEVERGLAVWPHLSEDGEPDLTVVCIGDLPADIVTRAVPQLRAELRIRVRVVAVHEMTVLGAPTTWPCGLSEHEFSRIMGAQSALLFVTLGHPAAVWGLLAGRTRRPCDVIGWTEPMAPMRQTALAERSRMSVAGVIAAARQLSESLAVNHEG